MQVLFGIVLYKIKTYITNKFVLKFKLGTSLTGKALVFGTKEYGFGSHVPNVIFGKPYLYVPLNLNILISKKLFFCKLILTKKILSISKIFFAIGLINNYKLGFYTKNNFKFIKFTIFFYKLKPFFKEIKIVSSLVNKYKIS